jgi:Protein of unknown function (DUF3618)
MTSVDRLEYETEQTRTRVSELLDELCARISPGDVVDQLMGMVNEGAAGDFVRTLGQQVRGNPLPCLLIGAGIGWLMLADRASASMSQAVSGASDTISGTARRFASGAHRMAESASGTIRTAASATTCAADALAGTASDVGHRTGDALRSAADRSRRAGATLGQMLQEQPLIAAGLGLAIGAAIGAALPVSATENRLLGETSDDLKRQARSMAAEQATRAREAAERTYEAAKESAMDVAHEAAAAAQESGFPIGTVRAELERDRTSPDAGSSASGDQGNKMEHPGRNGLGERQDEQQPTHPTPEPG